jgi:ABC-type sugar transport system, ATPase component
MREIMDKMNTEVIIGIRELHKQFPGVHALKGVTFNIKRNSIHCIIGENGSGKSTFIKILTGALNKTKGDIIFDDKPFDPKSVKDAKNQGIVALYQELNAVDDLTVEENLTLGREKNRLGIIRKNDDINKVEEILKGLCETISLEMQVGDLSTSQKQIIEIVKAVSTDCRVLVMDEPSAALSEEETRRMFEVVKKLKERGMTIIYISHKLSEVFEIGDYVTVFRDGQMVETKSVQEINKECKGMIPDACLELVKMMLGKVVVETYIPSKTDFTEKILEVKNIKNNKLKDVSFDLFKGEILGFYGLIGAGKTEVARVLYGIDDYNGEIFFKGKKVKYKNIRDALKTGVAMIPEERRLDGIFGKLALKSNIPMMKMKTILKYGLISSSKENKLADKFIGKMSIAARDREQKVAFLSGGNQQKVVISKCLNCESDILLMDEPTRGVDVGAKREIHDITRDLVKQGKGVIVFSSELPEILHLCDRIVLMHEGKVGSIIKNGAQVNSDQVMAVVAGGEC